MDSLQPQLEDLTKNVDDLESALQPLLTTPLSTTTTHLPLLDKAKLHILTTYALESLLFTSLRLSGIDAKSHPVFAELKRVKEYFGKITAAEEMGAGNGTVRARVDREAAGRFIKAGLQGNERYDRERKEREMRERAGAKRKLESVGTHTRFEGASKRMKEEGGESVGVVRASDLDDEDEGGSSFNEAADQTARKQKKGKKAKGGEDGGSDAMASLEETLAEPVSAETSTAEGKAGKKKKKNKKRKPFNEHADEMK